MTLSGNLGFVPIDEILRLLTRSKQQGAVEVTGDGITGRVFVGKGGIDLATTSDDSDLHRHLVNSGYAEESTLRRVTSGETTLAAIAESNQAIVDLIREMTVESLYQISHLGDEFEVHEGVVTQYASPKSFELETLLADSAEREREWVKVTDVVTNLTGAISFRRDLGEREEVSVKNDDWKVLSEIGAGSSIAEIADRLGTTEFWAARAAARLVKSDLIDLGAASSYIAPDPSTPTVGHASDSTEHDEYVEQQSYEEPAYQEAPADEYVAQAEPTADDESDEVFASEDAATDEHTVADPSESWWQEPEAEDDTPDHGAPLAPEVVAEGLSEMPAVDAKSSDGDEDVEEDTEAFLEKVFSELESGEAEADEGHGLLRRRRMGTLRDFSSDS